MPADWPPFEVTLKLDGRELTVAAGETVRLAELPMQAFVIGAEA